MDNTRTGALIRELRREAGMTQMELASLLHITDRAVSKWERGLSAPDIALLEPLSEALGVTITELIRGERLEIAEGEDRGTAQDDVKEALVYSNNEVTRKVSGTRIKYLGILATCLILFIAIGTLLLWRSGVLFILDRKTSPDGLNVITVYSKALNTDLFWLGFTTEDSTSIVGTHPGGGKTQITYIGAAYEGLWWAPDSKKYLLIVDFPDEPYWMLLHNGETNSVSNLNTMDYALWHAGLTEYGFANQNEYGLPDFTIASSNGARTASPCCSTTPLRTRGT